MSWTVACGCTLPRFSWMFGPIGAPGIAPRFAGTNEHRSEAPWPIHEHGCCPSAALSCGAVTALACPVAVAPTHNSMPLSFVFVKANRPPSGEKPIQPITGDGGSVTLRSAPSTTAFSVRLR